MLFCLVKLHVVTAHRQKPLHSNNCAQQSLFHFSLPASVFWQKLFFHKNGWKAFRNSMLDDENYSPLLCKLQRKYGLNCFWEHCRSFSFFPTFRLGTKLIFMKRQNYKFQFLRCNAMKINYWSFMNSIILFDVECQLSCKIGCWKSIWIWQGLLMQGRGSHKKLRAFVKEKKMFFNSFLWEKWWKCGENSS